MILLYKFLHVNSLIRIVNRPLKAPSAPKAIDILINLPITFGIKIVQVKPIKMSIFDKKIDFLLPNISAITRMKSVTTMLKTTTSSFTRGLFSTWRIKQVFTG